nr:hypothetical protein [Tanacetum cinerariifolium]
TVDILVRLFKANKLALLDQFLPGNKDDTFDPEADLREIEYLLYRDPSTDSSPKTDIDIIDPILERFIDEPALIYSFPSRDDDDDIFDFKFDNEEWQKIFDSTLPEESSESSEIATLLSSLFGNKDKTSGSLLEEFADELALLDPFLPGNKDDKFDPEADLREIEYLLYRDSSTDSSPKTDIDIIDPILERFIDEPALVY